MAFEPVVLINGLSQLTAAVAASFVARRFEKGCSLKKPFYFLSGSLLLLSLINILWFSGIASSFELDNILIIPFFHLAFMATWFYIGLFISGHRHIYYLIPLLIMSVNVLLLINNFAVVCDIIVGLVLIGVFFHKGLIGDHVLKKASLIGVVYGVLIACTSLLAHFSGESYIFGLWFIPNVVLVYLLLVIKRKGHKCQELSVTEQHRIPLSVEIVKFGGFIIFLSLFMMLGTLGVHELGHSLAANFFGCSHETTFGVGYAITHVQCESTTGSVFITLGGFILTVLVSLMMYFLGNDFAKRMSFILLAFSLLIASDDFAALSIPHSLFIAIVFISTLLIGYGLMLIVRTYEAEYDREDGLACPVNCGKESYLKKVSNP